MSLDLLLIDPPLSMTKRYGSFALCGSKSPQYGLCFIAAVVRREGFKVKILDMGITEMDNNSFREYILTNRPRIIGFTAVTIAVSDAARLAKICKETLPDVRIVIGGPHLSSTPEETMLRYTQFDIGVIGEGEETMLELLKLSDTMNIDYSPIDGLIWRNSNEVCYSKPRELIKDLSWLPLPAIDLLPDLKTSFIPSYFSAYRTPAITIMTTRGCPAQCTFCTNVIHGKRIRQFPLDYIFELIYLLTKKHGIKELQIADDSFTIGKKYVTAFCERLISEKIDVTWSCLTRVNTVTSELLSLMKRAGCWQISYGIESGDNEMLKKIKKGITVEQIRKAVTLAKQAGLNVKGFFIIGFPEETRESLKKTLDLALTLPVDDMSLTIFTPYPGTASYFEIHKYGTFNEDWDAMTTLNATFVANGFTRDELLELSFATYRKFYFRPRILLSYVRRVTEPKFILIILKGAYGLIATFFEKKFRFQS